MAQTKKVKSDLIGQRAQRIEKIEKLRKLGIDPFPSKANKQYENKEILEKFGGFEGKTVTLAGRLMSWRDHGHIVFGNIQDQSGQIQLYIKEEALEETNSDKQNIGFTNLNLIDVGDIIEATGEVTKTQRGEISIVPERIRMLAKAIRPLPEKWKGLKDKEIIYRKRYLDMIMDPKKRWRFEKTAEITYAIREFLTSKGYLEIKTPIIQPIYGGTNARPFKTHVNALDVDYFMAVSHELYLKRLITAGFDNVFNLVGYFRNEGIDRSHNPEFTMIETMSAFNNYEYNMELTEEMYKFIAEKAFDRTMFKIGEQDVDFGKPWERMSMLEAVKKHAGYDFDKITELKDARKAVREAGYTEDMPKSVGECMVKVFEEKVEEKLVQPTFITGHPVEISPLAKSMDSDPRFVERFEIFIGGIEGGDNWTELNDPIELFNRFKDQAEKGCGGDDESHPMDIEFVEMMEYGMPPTTGLGPGIERLAMMLTETDYIDDVIFFPMMRPAQTTKQQEEIYGKENIMPVGQVGKKEQDKSQKMVLVLSKELVGWQLTNTVGHLTAYLGSKIGSENILSRPTFATKEDQIPADSQYPVVALSAKPGQMYNLLEKVEAEGLVHLAYVQEMIDFDDDEELAKALESKNKKDLSY